MAQNVRRPVTANEPYDPKQRAIGAVVLALIMLLIYSFLQALVTLTIPDDVVKSSAGEGYRLSDIKPDEVTKEVPEDANGDVYVPNLPSNMMKFVFLDIDGTPFGTNTGTQEENSTQSTPLIGTHWIVQAASFKEYSRAEKLVEELKLEGIDTEIKKIGSWYTVRTFPQRTEAEAKQMKVELRRVGIKNGGLLKKIE